MRKWIYIGALIAYTVITLGFFIHAGTSQEITVPGRVVDSKWNRHVPARTPSTYNEIVSFELNGKTHRFVRKPSSWWKPKIGRTREVAVDPANPMRARTRMAPWLEKVLPDLLKQNPDIFYPWLVGYAAFWIWFLFGFFSHEDTKQKPTEKIRFNTEFLMGCFVGGLVFIGTMGLLLWTVSLID